MKSIRRRLTITLLGGLALLWLLAGGGVYFAVRSGLLKAIDAELAIDAQVLRFVVRGDGDGDGEPADAADGARPGPGRRMQARLPVYDEPGSGYFYQGWAAEEEVDRSPSLGDRRLAFPGELGGDPVFATAQLDDGTRVRAMSFRVSSGGKGRTKGERRRAESATTITIAQDLAAFDATLRSLLGGIAIVGGLAAAGAIVLVGGALNRGLRPLRELGARAREIDVNSLDARFDASRAPLELQPIHRRLNELMDRLQGSFERERRFSSDLAHEMRTPIAELKMLTEVALKWPDQADPKTHEESLAIAVQLEAMVENLLALARWESGEAPLKRESVAMEAAIRQAWRPYESRAMEKQLGVTFEFAAGDRAIDSGPEMLRHIVANLLSNAVEYTPEQGEIVIRVLDRGFEIANTVSGLSEEDVERVFDRYWRSDEARGDTAHVGLGLSLAKACAEALGHELSARLEDGWICFRLEAQAG